MKSQFIIYGLIDPRTQELRYVGMTTTIVEQRLKQHLGEAKRGVRTHRHNWLRELQSEGLVPDIEALETCNTFEAMNDAEPYHIAYFRMIGCNLTNQDPGGRGRKKFCPSPETRQKLSIARMGEGNSFWGREHSLETRNKISVARSGQPVTDEYRARMSQIKTGVTHTLESRQKMSKAQKGHPTSAETKQKISLALQGRVQSEEACIRKSRAAGVRPFVDQYGVIYQTQRSAARLLGLCQGHIGKVLRGQYAQTGGYTFKYLEL